MDRRDWKFGLGETVDLCLIPGLKDASKLDGAEGAKKGKELRNDPGHLCIGSRSRYTHVVT